VDVKIELVGRIVCTVASGGLPSVLMSVVEEWLFLIYHVICVSRMVCGAV
jgi:hypothetical protein